MCTVTYLPLSPAGFVLTSTRDEKTARKPAIPPEKHDIHGQKVCFPRDAEAGGTWIAAAEKGYSLCLLNGGFTLHESRPPYRLSRGLMLLDFYRYNDVKAFCRSYEFEGIEPFTLVIAGHGSLDEIRWDGGEIHRAEKNPGIPAIWSSVTLYAQEVIRMRQDWFHKWLLGNPGFCIAEAVAFHKKAGTGDIRNDIMMDRDGEVRTVSITSIFRGNTCDEMYYEDTLSGKTYHTDISGERMFIWIA
jgi:hypothetical protein